MIGIEAKPLLELGHSCFKFPLVGMQTAKNDMRIGVLRIDLGGFLGGGAVFLNSFAIVQRIEMMAHCEPGLRPGEAPIDLDGPEQECASRPRFPIVSRACGRVARLGRTHARDPFWTFDSV